VIKRLIELHFNELKKGAFSPLGLNQLSLRLKIFNVETAIQIFDYAKWHSELPELSKQYQSANPYPHIVLENFLN